MPTPAPFCSTAALYCSALIAANAVRQQLLQKLLFAFSLFEMRMMQWSVQNVRSTLRQPLHCTKSNHRYRGAFCAVALATMPKKANNDTKALRRARHMPRLRHALPGEEFRSANSEALNWLCSQPEIRDAIFTYCAQRDAIVYDKADGTWRGAYVP